MTRTGAVIMAGGGSPTPIEQQMTAWRRLCAVALARVLAEAGVELLVVCLSQPDWWPSDLPAVLDVDSGPFHFGERLAAVIQAQGLDRVLYFGAASAPLLTADMVRDLLARLADDRPYLVTNNVHSSDWVAFNAVSRALDTISRTERDNSLAWTLRETAGFQADVLSHSYPQLLLDLDTPADFAIVAHHPDCPPALRQAVQTSPLLAGVPVEAVLAVLRREESQVTLIGRVSPGAWQAINDVTRCWIRVFAEERGMVASGRVARGEARSLLGVLLDYSGTQGFFEHLATMADAAIIDSRVLMAQRGPLPPPHIRYLADLFDVSVMTDPAHHWLRDFTLAAAAAPIPVLLGGHSVVSGGLRVLAAALAGDEADVS